MAYDQSEMATLAAAFQALPNEVKALLSSKSTADNQEAFASLTVQMRGTSMDTALAAVVTVSTSNRAALRELAAVADGATLIEACKEFRTAMQSDSAPLTGAVAVALAALKHYGL